MCRIIVCISWRTVTFGLKLTSVLLQLYKPAWTCSERVRVLKCKFVFVSIGDESESFFWDSNPSQIISENDRIFSDSYYKLKKKRFRANTGQILGQILQQNILIF